MLIVAALAGVVTGLETVSVGGYPEGGGPRPAGRAIVTLAALGLGGVVAALTGGRRMAVAAALALLATVIGLLAPGSTSLLVGALVAAGLAAGAAASLLLRTRRSVPGAARSSTALVAAGLAVGVCLAPLDAFGLLAVVVVLPAASAVGAVLAPHQQTN